MAKSSLNNRQRVLIGGLLVALVLGGGYMVVVRDLMAGYEASERTLSATRERLQSARLWASEVRAEQQGHAALDELLAQRGVFDLFTFTNDALQKLGLKEQATLSNLTRPSTLAEIEVTVRGATLEELVNLLHFIQSEGKLVAVRAARMYPAPDSRGLICTMTLASPRS
jgi:hypothetical protein